MESQAAPQGWLPIDTAPKDGSLMDVRFDIAGAEPGMAEFYAPGCTKPGSAAEPIISNVAFANGHFRPVVDAAGASELAALRGGLGQVRGTGYALLSVTLTAWRPAVTPPLD